MAKCISSIPMSLGRLIKNFESGAYVIPDWQRGFVWPKSKQIEWEQRLRKEIKSADCPTVCNVPGTIVIARIKDINTIIINDGVQRLTSTRYLKEESHMAVDCFVQPLSYDDLDNIIINVQEWEYESTEEAYREFTNINRGTTLSPCDMAKGVLTTQMDKQTFEQIQTIHQIIKEVEARLKCSTTRKKGRIDARTRAHQQRRDNYALFYRFCSEDMDLSSYQCGKTTIKDSEKIADFLQKSIETKLVDMYHSTIKTLSNLESKIGLFRDMVFRFAAEAETDWEQFRNDCLAKNITIGNAIEPELMRFLLHARIHNRNNHKRISEHDFRDFMKSVFENTRGRNRVKDRNPERVRLGIEKSDTSFACSDLSRMEAVCDAFGSDYFQKIQSKKRKSNSDIIVAEGYDKSHVDAFSIHGDGIVVPEPSSRNRARGSGSISS